jgi:hypothetical protein
MTAEFQQAMNANLKDQIYHLVGCYNLSHKEKLVVVTLPNIPPTASEMAERIMNGETVFCRKGCRGQLVGQLKRRGIFATSKAQPDGNYLFTPSKPRKFKP